MLGRSALMPRALALVCRATRKSSSGGNGSPGAPPKNRKGPSRRVVESKQIQLTSSPPSRFARSQAGRAGIPTVFSPAGPTHLGGSCCWRPYRTAHFTGDPGMVLPFERFQSALTDIPGGHPVGVLAVAAGHAEKRRLSLAIVGMSMPALGALLAGMPGRHGHQPATGPLNLVVELTAKLTPSPGPGSRDSARPSAERSGRPAGLRYTPARGFC